VIEVEFEAVAEVRRRDAGRIVAFQFTTTWPQSEASIASPEHRVVVQRDVRRLDGALTRALAAWPSWSGQERSEITTRAVPLMPYYNRLRAALWPHELRHRRGVKLAQWRWRLGQNELCSHGLGPILLSEQMTLDELHLKLALLSAKSGVMDPPELVARLQDYLQATHDDAEEVVSRFLVGTYIGDTSPLAFRSYLRKLLRSHRRDRSGGRAQHESSRNTLRAAKPPFKPGTEF